MGIKQLSSLLKKEAAAALGIWRPAEDYRGEVVAIDASPCLYQCLTTSSTVGQEDDASHIFGILRRTVKLLELGIYPIFVFDGEAPEMKKDGALSHRALNRARSREQLLDAQKCGDMEAIRKFSARLVKTTQRHNNEAMELLELMGVPAIQAPGEAECLCCAMAIAGVADSVATEDFDALAFGAPKTLRFLHQAVAQYGDKKVQEIRLEDVLAGLKYTHKEFLDLCILCGCDYLGTITNVGAQTAHKLMSKHRSIENVLAALDKNKYKVPELWDYQAARACFSAPDVDAGQIPKLSKARPEELRELLVGKYKSPTWQADQYINRLVKVSGRVGTAASKKLSGASTKPFVTPRKIEPQQPSTQAGSMSEKVLQIATPTRTQARSTRGAPKPLHGQASLMMACAIASKRQAEEMTHDSVGDAGSSPKRMKTFGEGLPEEEQQRESPEQHISSGELNEKCLRDSDGQNNSIMHMLYRASAAAHLPAVVEIDSD